MSPNADRPFFAPARVCTVCDAPGIGTVSQPQYRKTQSAVAIEARHNKTMARIWHQVRYEVGARFCYVSAPWRHPLFVSLSGEASPCCWFGQAGHWALPGGPEPLCKLHILDETSYGAGAIGNRLPEPCNITQVVTAQSNL